jgi:hypothetical protein
MCINIEGWKDYLKGTDTPGPSYGDFCHVTRSIVLEGLMAYFLSEWPGCWSAKQFIPVQDQPVEYEQVSVQEPALAEAD